MPIPVTAPNFDESRIHQKKKIHYKLVRTMSRVEAIEIGLNLIASSVEIKKGACLF